MRLTLHVGLIQFLLIIGYIYERLSLDIILPLLRRDPNAQCKLMYIVINIIIGECCGPRYFKHVDKADAYS